MWSDIDLNAVHTRYQANDNLKVLCVSSAGVPLRWINWKHAARYSSLNMIHWGIANEVIEVNTSRRCYYLPTILAVSRSHRKWVRNPVPPISNTNLFRRDNYTCMYCGKQFCASDLTRDHVYPTSKGGKTTWLNITSACEPCNVKKADAETPEEAGLTLLTVPYEPSYAEYLILSNHRILYDQMEFLKSGMRNPSSVN